jgi:hypothetical protein
MKTKTIEVKPLLKDLFRHNMIQEIRSKINDLEQRNSVNLETIKKIQELKDDLYYWQNEELSR